MRVIEQQVDVFSVSLRLFLVRPREPRPTSAINPAPNNHCRRGNGTRTAKRPCTLVLAEPKAGGTQSVRRMTGWVRLPGVHHWRMHSPVGSVSSSVNLLGEKPLTRLPDKAVMLEFVNVAAETRALFVILTKLVSGAYVATYVPTLSEKS